MGKGAFVLSQMNAAVVLSVLQRTSSVTISDIAAETGLSRPAVSRAVRILENDGLARPLPAPEEAASRLGRPAQSFRFGAEAGYTIGVEFDPPVLRAALADLSGNVADHLERKIAPTPSADEVYDLIEGIVRDLSSTRATDARFRSVAIGLAGIVDPSTGLVDLDLIIPGLDGLPLRRVLEERLDCPVVVENNVKLAVMAESWRGVSADRQSVVYVHWGKRIGTGIIIDGKLIRGSRFAAGEIGYLDLFGDEDANSAREHPQAYFEQMVGADSVLDTLRSLDRDRRRAPSTGAQDFADSEAALLALFAKRPPSEKQRRAIEPLVGRFSRGIRVLQLLFDPECIVIGGPMSEIGFPIEKMILEHIGKSVLYPMSVEISALGSDAIVLGGIYAALARLGLYQRS